MSSLPKFVTEKFSVEFFPNGLEIIVLSARVDGIKNILLPKHHIHTIIQTFKGCYVKCGNEERLINQILSEDGDNTSHLFYFLKNWLIM